MKKIRMIYPCDSVKSKTLTVVVVRALRRSRSWHGRGGLVDGRRVRRVASTRSGAAAGEAGAVGHATHGVGVSVGAGAARTASVPHHVRGVALGQHHLVPYELGALVLFLQGADCAATYGSEQESADLRKDGSRLQQRNVHQVEVKLLARSAFGECAPASRTRPATTAAVRCQTDTDVPQLCMCAQGCVCVGTRRS